MKITSDISSAPTTAAEGQKSDKLVDAAHQFEATMLQELLKPMRSGENGWGSEEQGEDGTSDTISSFGAEAAAKAISKAGGFGIARRVVSQITTQTQKQIERNHANTKV